MAMSNKADPEPRRRPASWPRRYPRSETRYADAAGPAALPQLGVAACCRALGRSRASYYRSKTPRIGPARKRSCPRALSAPEQQHVLATAPSQLWSWDITKLPEPTKWSYFYLYVLLDVFSRYVVESSAAASWGPPTPPTPSALSAASRCPPSCPRPSGSTSPRRTLTKLNFGVSHFH